MASFSDFVTFNYSSLLVCFTSLQKEMFLTWKPSQVFLLAFHHSSHQSQGGTPGNLWSHSCHYQRSGRHDHKTLQGSHLESTCCKSSKMPLYWASHPDSPPWSLHTTHVWLPRHTECLPWETGHPAWKAHGCSCSPFYWKVTSGRSFYLGWKLQGTF